MSVEAVRLSALCGEGRNVTFIIVGMARERVKCFRWLGCEHCVRSFVVTGVGLHRHLLIAGMTVCLHVVSR